MTATNTNVNSDSENTAEINVSRLGSQQKEILRFLYDLDGEVRQQVDIIEEVYGEVTDTRKASVSRSISKLREAGIMYEQNSLYYPKLEAWCRARPRYGITRAGVSFLEDDDRFPNITPADDEDPTAHEPDPSQEEPIGAVEAFVKSFGLTKPEANAVISSGVDTPEDVIDTPLSTLTDTDTISQKRALRMKAIALDAILTRSGDPATSPLNKTIPELAADTNIPEDAVASFLQIYTDALSS
jgi:hypothetical protein